MKNQPVKFLENKGQMMDMAGNPVPFVLFKVEAPGVNAPPSFQFPFTVCVYAPATNVPPAPVIKVLLTVIPEEGVNVVLVIVKLLNVDPSTE